MEEDMAVSEEVMVEDTDMAVDTVSPEDMVVALEEFMVAVTTPLQATLT